jgi:hypothetical protein
MTTLFDVPARQPTQACAIISLKSIPGLLKRLQTWAQESVICVCVGVGKTVRGLGFPSLCNYLSMVLIFKVKEDL